MARVLVSDGQLRSALTAVRALGRAGHDVLVAEDMRCTMTFFSRYAERAAVCPPTVLPQFGEWLQAFVGREGVEVFLPIDDGATAAAVHDPPTCASLLPSPDAFALFRDKARTMELAAAAGVPTPDTVQAADDPQVARRQAADLGYPVAVKPRATSGGRGMRLVEREAELVPALAAVRTADPRPLLQHWLAGAEQVDVGVLCGRDGVRRAVFMQRELRRYPLVGGPSTVQESCWLPQLLEPVDRLLAAAGWVGPAEFEFLLTSDGHFHLIEVNPRFWASLGLAVAAGVDFPRLSVALALGEHVACPARYPLGLQVRWLLPGDILHYLANPERARMRPAFWRPYRDDVWDPDDPGPLVGFVFAAAAMAMDRERRHRVLRAGATA